MNYEIAFSACLIIQFNNYSIPEHTLIKGLDKIFKVNDIHLDLYFKTLKPANFIDLEVTETQSEEDQEKEGVSSEDIKDDFVEMSDDDMGVVYDDLEGEIIEDEKWESCR